MGTFLKVVGGVIVGCVVVCAALAVLVGVISNRSTTTSATSADTEHTGQSTVAGSKAPLGGIGQAIQVADVKWVILEAKDLGNRIESDNQFIEDAKTSGHFVQVRFEIENLGKELKSFTGLNLVDNQERTYTSSSDTISFIPDDEQCIIIENLNPNVPRTCTAIFEVPATASGIMAKVTDLAMFGSEDGLVDLQLE